MLSFGESLNRLIFELMTSAIFCRGVISFFCASQKGFTMDFLTSIGVLLLCGLLLGSICKRIHLPSLVGMLVVGIVLSPYALNLLSPDLLTISADIRQLALIIILTRAGLSFDLAELKKNGRSAIMLCFVPALFEIVGYLVFGSLFRRYLSPRHCRTHYGCEGENFEFHSGSFYVVNLFALQLLLSQ